MLAIGNVPGKAPRVHEPSFVPQDIRADQDVPDAAVFRPEPGLIITERFVACQTVQDIGDDVRFRMKLGDMPADVFFGAKAQQLHLSRIGPQNASIRSNAMQTTDALSRKSARSSCVR